MASSGRSRDGGEERGIQEVSLLFQPSVSRLPLGGQMGPLQVDALKEEIGRCTEKLSASEEAVQREGAAQLHSAMLDIWSLGAGELSRKRGRYRLRRDSVRTTWILGTV